MKSAMKCRIRDVRAHITKPITVRACVCALVFAVALDCSVLLNGVFGMTVPALIRQTAEGTDLTVIDVRSTAMYAQGHIPNAINIPAALVPEKSLPPLGKVVVCDDGLGGDSADSAVAALNGKRGIQAEALIGGYTAWQTAKGITTEERGLKEEVFPHVTYKQLENVDVRDMVLVDLRKPKLQSRQSVPVGPLQAGEELTDLESEFPGARVTRSLFDLPQTRQAVGGSETAPPVFVLIDDGDGEAAKETARMLKANGIERVAILAGGESIISRHGRSGLKRIGIDTGFRPDAP